MGSGPRARRPAKPTTKRKGGNMSAETGGRNAQGRGAATTGLVVAGATAVVAAAVLVVWVPAGPDLTIESDSPAADISNMVWRPPAQPAGPEGVERTRKAPTDVGKPLSPTEQEHSARFLTTLQDQRGQVAPALAALSSGRIAPEVVAYRDPRLFPMVLKKYLFEIGTSATPVDFANLVDLLLSAGADPDTSLGSGRKPINLSLKLDATHDRPNPALWFAVETLNVDLTAVLLHHGARVDPWSPSQPTKFGDMGWSALQGLALGCTAMSVQIGRHMLALSHSSEAEAFRAGSLPTSADDSSYGSLVRQLDHYSFSPESGINTGHFQFWLHSPAYRQLAKAAIESPSRTQLLQNLLQAEAPLIATIFRLLIEAGLDLPACITLCNTFGHNALHVAAEGGNVAFVEAVTGVASEAAKSNSAEKQLRLGTAIKIALQARDIRGRTPMHYAAMYGGVGSEDSGLHVTSALHELAAVTSSLGDINIDLIEACAPDNSEHSCDFYQRHMEQVTDGVNKSSKDSMGEEKHTLGGWTQTTYGVDLYGPDPPDRCDIDEIVVRKGWKLANLRKAIEPYIQASAPVVIRGGVSMLKGLRASLTKEALIKDFGERPVSIGPIPYHETFEIEGKTMSMREYIGHIEEDAALVDGPAAPMYLFSRDFAKSIPRLTDKLAVITKATAGIDGVSTSATPTDGLQFYLGGPGTGAQFHWHHAALNAQAWGKKRWFMFPRSRAMYSTLTAREWISSANHSGVPSDWTQLELVQHAGDLVFVPHGWAHQTLNIETSVGVAYEDFMLKSSIEGELNW